MTLTQYNQLVVEVRSHFTSLVETAINRKRLGASYDLGVIEDQIAIISHYLYVLEDYFLPAVVIATGASGDSSLSLYSSITPSDYSRYIGHTITGTGISDGQHITRFDANNIYLSDSITATSSNAEFTIAENCLTVAEMRCIITDINRILGTNFCFDGYWTEFGTVVPTAASTNVLLTGSSPTILTGSTIYAALDVDTAPAGDTNVLFNFSIEYPYFSYKSTIPDLTQILDQEGDDVLASGTFTKSLMNVSFPGIAGTTQYKVYTTGHKTTIDGKTYQFKF